MVFGVQQVGLIRQFALDLSAFAEEGRPKDIQSGTVFQEICRDGLSPIVAGGTERRNLDERFAVVAPGRVDLGARLHENTHEFQLAGARRFPEQGSIVASPLVEILRVLAQQRLQPRQIPCRAMSRFFFGNCFFQWPGGKFSGRTNRWGAASSTALENSTLSQCLPLALATKTIAHIILSSQVRKAGAKVGCVTGCQTVLPNLTMKSPGKGKQPAGSWAPHEEDRWKNGNLLKAAIAEAIGAFTLSFIGVLAIAAVSTIKAPAGLTNLTSIALAHGLAIFVMVAALGAVSGWSLQSRGHSGIRRHATH